MPQLSFSKTSSLKSFSEFLCREQLLGYYLNCNELAKNRRTQKAILMPIVLYRDSDNKLMVPQPHTEYLKRCFNCSGALLWNNFP